jgi:hypothetical protein
LEPKLNGSGEGVDWGGPVVPKGLALGGSEKRLAGLAESPNRVDVVLLAANKGFGAMVSVSGFFWSEEVPKENDNFGGSGALGGVSFVSPSCESLAKEKPDVEEAVSTAAKGGNAEVTPPKSGVDVGVTTLAPVRVSSVSKTLCGGLDASSAFFLSPSQNGFSRSLTG